MTPTHLFLRSLISPKLALGHVIRIELEWRTVVEAAVFVSVVNTLLTHLFNLMTYTTNQSQENLLGPYIDLVLNRPFLLCLIEFTKIIFIASMLTYAGRLFSGTGTFLDNLKGVVWIHFILIFINVGLFGAMQLNITLAGYFVILTNFWIMWILSECAVRTHGFKSTFMVFVVGILLFMLILALFIILVDALGINFLERVGLSA